MNPNEIYKALTERGYEMADTQCTYQQLDDQTKSLLAELTLSAKDVEGVNSMAEAKEIALASSRYRDHLSEVAEGRRTFTKAQVRYYATRSLFEAQRTVEASERVANRAAT